MMFSEGIMGGFRRSPVPLSSKSCCDLDPEIHLRRILKDWVAHYNHGRPHSALGPGIPEPSEGIPVLEISGQRIPPGHRVVGSSVLGGLDHEYRLEKVAA